MKKKNRVLIVLALLAMSLYFMMNIGPFSAGVTVIPFMFIIFLGIIIFFVGAILIIMFIFWLWMLIDCVTREMKGSDKVVWVIVIVLVGIIGAIIYYFVVKRNMDRKKKLRQKLKPKTVSRKKTKMRRRKKKLP